MNEEESRLAEKEKESRELYEGMAKEAPEREVEEMIEEERGHKSLSAEEEESPNLSDLQVTLRKMFPDFGDKVYNAIMQARVAPDMFIPLLRILVNSEIKRSDPHKALNIAEIASKFYVLASIGLDGKGRIDTIELAGSAREDEELAALGKSMGSTF